MSRPRLLDLFCGAGGAAMGYHGAGFDVVGVDINPQPHYPFEFHQADALTFPLDGFDAIHASPPCQRYSVATLFHRGAQGTHPDLVDPTRQRLIEADVPWVIENVMGAPLRNPVMLCGTMFAGLRVYRHRNFEADPPIYFPPMHEWHPERAAEVGRRVPAHGWMTVAGHFSDVKAASLAMGIDWMTRDELRQAIPPAYTEWVGAQLLRAMGVAA
ncbi:MAG TPA: DNA cytosine methyltransferase [Solirubrobacteraceae bacterium]